MVPECKRTAKTRGMCENCYAGAARKVREKQTTWEELERLGLCRQAITVGPRKANKFTQAFDKAKGVVA